MTNQSHYDHLCKVERFARSLLKNVLRDKAMFVRDCGERGMVAKRSAELFEDIKKGLGVG